MKKVFVIIVIVIVVFISIFVYKRKEAELYVDDQIEEKEVINMYKQISMEEAKEIFKTKGDYIIVDVRRPDEFAEGHIPSAINIVNEEITTAPKELKDKSQVIYVYCRSGRRSKEASEKLVNLGYTNIIEFGGIIDWTGDIEK
ncbi:MAG: rhodanese-like domain-containing protein [Erysipelotrichaceae bacterium]|nr:rhodanese-like domain-containing protein [Erysipelotrichaceae bacterium]